MPRKVTQVSRWTQYRPDSWRRIGGYDNTEAMLSSHWEMSMPLAYQVPMQAANRCPEGLEVH